MISGSVGQVGALDGRTSMPRDASVRITTSLQSFSFQLTLTTNQHALLIDFDACRYRQRNSGRAKPHGLRKRASTAGSHFSTSASTRISLPVTVAGTFLASNNSIPVNNPNSPVNTQDFTYVPLSTNTLTVVTNDITLSGVYTNVADSFGRGTITMNSTRSGHLTFCVLHD